MLQIMRGKDFSLSVYPVTNDEYAALLSKCLALPPAKGNYIINDYIENVLLTVLDFQMQTVAVERAASHYLKYRHDAIRTHQDLKKSIASHPDTKEGNLDLAQYLWGYNLWTRAEMLRRLLAYFETLPVPVTTQDQLRTWAYQTEFKDFKGKVKGMGYAIFKWLVMRQGVETIKPDVWVHRFVKEAIGRSVTDEVAVAMLEQIAKQIDRKAYELDWQIWEYQRSLPSATA